jgi:hypothetical protein
MYIAVVAVILGQALLFGDEREGNARGERRHRPTDRRTVADLNGIQMLKQRGGGAGRFG